MSSGHYFRHLRRRRPEQAAAGEPTTANLLGLLNQYVLEPFARLSGAGSLAIALGPPVPENDDDPPPGPSHPACAEYAGSDYCRESWQLHLAELSRAPETQWHRCDFDRLCAVVPVVHRGRCLALVRLVGRPTTTESEFERIVEVMDLLVLAFERSVADFLDRLPWTTTAADPDPAPRPAAGEVVELQPTHPHIRRALQYIQAHLADPKLAVGRIARELDVHPNHLGRLFVERTGQRMTRYIAGRRIAVAQTLLTTTDWQIKRIAHETGHANPNWFVHLFGACTGLTPGAYRRKWREPPDA